MLRYLRVSNLAVVREVSIELDEGLTVLTGETGAGKSVLVDALTLLLGARASSDLVRTGEDLACVEGIFRVEQSPAALEALRSIGVEPEEGEVVLRREVSASGKGRAFIAGALHPLHNLKRLGVALADVYGQHEHVRLLDPASHLDLLDHFAGLSARRAELGRDAARLAAAEARLREVTEGEGERARRADFLRFELGEIEDARLDPDEEPELEQERERLAHRARIAELSEGAFQVLYESDGAVLDRLSALHRDLVELASFDARLKGLPAELEAARLSLAEVALQLRDHARDLPPDGGRLEQVETRLGVLARLKRKYGQTLQEVLAFARDSRLELERIEADRGAGEACARERDAARAHYRDLAEEVSRIRSASRPGLERKVEEELASLAMEGSTFRIELLALPGATGSTGLERAEFHFSANPGEEPRPLHRVASGGELSRLLLALRVVAQGHEPERIAVFHGLEAGLGGRVTVLDEVDAGIGGRVSFVLARKLQKLARGRQVLCVTHLAPVAAAADRHFRVIKEERRGRTAVKVEPLSGMARVEELSRMIGGDEVSPAVRRHAEELLESSHRGDPGAE